MYITWDTELTAELITPAYNIFPKIVYASSYKTQNRKTQYLLINDHEVRQTERLMLLNVERWRSNATIPILSTYFQTVINFINVQFATSSLAFIYNVIYTLTLYSRDLNFSNVVNVNGTYRSELFAMCYLADH
jgi:hypothetical protein